MQNIWKKNAKLMLILLLDIFIISGATYAATTMYQSNIVGYDNSTSGLNSTNVQGALDEVYSVATDYTSLAARVSALEAVSLVDEIYPVGSIYTSINSTNPGTLFGGTWEAFGTGKTLVGVDTSQTEFDTVEETGGEKTHTLTINEMPSHLHNTQLLTTDGNWSVYDTISAWSGGVVTATKVSGQTTRYVTFNAMHNPSTGGDGPHNNLQPYITVYMWKRTA